MSIQLLFGTTNPAKIEYVRTVLKPLPIEILWLNDLNIDIDVAEDGINPGDNALIKSMAYYRESKIPTFSFDSGLYIEKFSEDKQPGLFVRRINGKKATDQEMIDYYISELDKVGGESKARWITSVALVLSLDKIYTEDFTENTVFTSKPSPITNPGNPLNSIQIDPYFKKYISEITPEERSKTQGQLDIQIFNFFAAFLKGILQ